MANVYATWNPSDKDTDVILSGGDLTMSSAAGGGLWVGVQSNLGVSTGKWYWEYTIGGSGASGWLVGAGDGVANPRGYPGQFATSEGYQSNGNKQGEGIAYGATYTAGDVIGVALDMGAGTMVMYKNNTSQGTIKSGITGTWYAHVGVVRGEATTITANFGATTMAFTAPSGFNQGLFTSSTPSSSNMLLMGIG